MKIYERASQNNQLKSKKSTCVLIKYNAFNRAIKALLNEPNCSVFRVE